MQGVSTLVAVSVFFLLHISGAKKTNKIEKNSGPHEKPEKMPPIASI
jgi:hypothetical protein